LAGGRRRYALFIDGDIKGPSWWPLAMEAVRERGDLSYAGVAAPPEYAAIPAWSKAMSSLGIHFIPVPRPASGVKDPNDIAIGMEAARLVSLGRADAVALAVTDVDFVYLARRLHEWGHGALAVISEGTQIGLASAFRVAHADVAFVKLAPKDQRLSKLKFLLHSNGESTLEPLTGQERLEFDPDMESVIAVLAELGYLASADDPIVPAIAKFFHTNGVGPLTVWPERCPRREMASLLTENGGREWRASTGDLAFVFPRAQHAGGTPKELRTYGSKACSTYARGGGPFITRSSRDLVDRVMRRLGYLDELLNADLGEALDVFCSMTWNFRALAAAGLGASSRVDAETKRALVHCALVSPKLYGTWQVAPKDREVRSWLFARREISGLDLPAVEVMPALRSFAARHQLPERKTYNAQVLEVLRHLRAKDPSRRR